MLLVQENAEGLSQKRDEILVFFTYETAVAVHDVGSGLDVAMTARTQVTWVRKKSHAMGAWFRMTLGALAQRDIEVPMYLSHPPPFGYDGWILFFLSGLWFRNCRPLLVPWLNDVIHWSSWVFSSNASRDVKGFQKFCTCTLARSRDVNLTDNVMSL